ncbi:MAG: ABC transporter ATP-binding protein [Angelakisella sp.]|nr:ABC transporter ATP-binding protein [Angelakisella sp.]
MARPGVAPLGLAYLEILHGLWENEVIHLDLLRVQDITESYQAENGEIFALDHICFSMEKGEFLSIVGPSGCGKSTLLSIIAGLLPPSSGTVLLDGQEIHGVDPRIGYMLQKDNLLEWRSIWRNVLFGLEVRRQVNEETTARARGLLQSYGLWEFREKYPSQLSGGMRQRAALIRTLATSPEILLLDEAFSALDYQTRLTVTDDVYRILKKEQITTIMVTHDIPESISMGDRVLILTSRPAQVRELLEIDFGSERTPLTCRGDPRFSRYFDHIWKELKSDG